MQRRDDGWYFEHDGQEIGPYDTKAEAEQDQRGLARFERYKDSPGFLTVDEPRHSPTA